MAGIDYFTGELRLFACNAVPPDFLPCDGRLIAISLNPALFSLLGTTYGGNGVSNFALPDVRGVGLLGTGGGFGLSFYNAGDTGGAETVALVASEVPSHTHLLNAASGPATDDHPAGNVLAPVADAYAHAAAPVAMAAVAASPAVAHENLLPCVYLQYCICVNGLYP